MDNGTRQLQEYITTLERELETKSKEQETLYRALQSAQQELAFLDQMHRDNQALRQEVESLRVEIDLMHQQKQHVEEMGRELAWSRVEIVKLSQCLQSRDFEESQHEEIYQQNEELNQEVSNLRFQVQKLESSRTDLETEISQERSHNQILKCQIKQWEEKYKSARLEGEALHQKLNQLSSNYEKVQQAVIEKDSQLQSLREDNFDLRAYLRELQQDMGQKNIMINCLESELEEARETLGDRNEIEWLQEIDKVDLIKQTNNLIEKVNFMERQNRGVSVGLSQKQQGMQEHLKQIKEQFENLSSIFTQ